MGYHMTKADGDCWKATETAEGTSLGVFLTVSYKARVYRLTGDHGDCK